MERLTQINNLYSKWSNLSWRPQCLNTRLPSLAPSLPHGQFLPTTLSFCLPEFPLWPPSLPFSGSLAYP